MKKFTTKLLMSIIAVAFAFVALGTSTYAWFSMNTQVSVSSLDISATSNVTYLLVSRSNTGDTAPASAAAIQAENSGAGWTSVVISEAEPAELFPVAPASALSVAEYYTAADEAENAEHVEGTLKTAATKTNYVAGDGIGAPTYWYTMIGTDATSSGYVGVANSEADVTSDIISGNYVKKYTFYFTIADGANNAQNLVVDEITFNGADAAARCLVVGADGSALFTGDTDVDSISLVDTLDSTHVYAVSVFLYFDGNANTIYTNNSQNIADANVAIKFAVTASNN